MLLRACLIESSLNLETHMRPTQSNTPSGVGSEARFKPHAEFSWASTWSWLTDWWMYELSGRFKEILYSCRPTPHYSILPKPNASACTRRRNMSLNLEESFITSKLTMRMRRLTNSLELPPPPPNPTLSFTHIHTHTHIFRSFNFSPSYLSLS